MFWWHMKSTYALWKLSGRNNDAGDGYAIICIQAHKISFRMHFSFTCTCTSMHAHTHTHTITHIYIYIYMYLPRSPKQIAMQRPNMWNPPLHLTSYLDQTSTTPRICYYSSDISFYVLLNILLLHSIQVLIVNHSYCHSLPILWVLGIPQCIVLSLYGSASWGPEDDAVRVETCSPAITLYVLYLLLLCLTDTFCPL